VEGRRTVTSPLLVHPADTRVPVGVMPTAVVPLLWCDEKGKAVGSLRDGAGGRDRWTEKGSSKILNCETLRCQDFVELDWLRDER